jgi:hypothetical protein
MLDTLDIRRLWQQSKAITFGSGMKREIVEYIARCMECQKVKAEHRIPNRVAATFTHS